MNRQKSIGETKMEVILKSDVKSLGKKGEKVNVAEGYARNFLFPRNLAIEISAQSMTELKNRESSAQHKKDTDLANAKANKAKLDGKIVKISARAGANGKLFGSVTVKDVCETVKKEFNIDLDKRKVTMDDIKAFGTYECKAKLYPEVATEFKVKVGED